MKYRSLLKSSFHDPRCCDESATVVNGTPLAYRAQTSSITCVLDGNGKNTGFVHIVTLEQYNIITLQSTGVTKPNLISDADYVRDYQDAVRCPGDATPPTIQLVISNYLEPNALFIYAIEGGLGGDCYFGDSTSIPVSAGALQISLKYEQDPAHNNYANLSITIDGVDYPFVSGVGQILNLNSPHNISLTP